MSLETAAALAIDPVWRAKVTAAVVRTAVLVAAEVAADEAAVRVRRRRSALAREVLEAPEALAARFAWALAARGATGTETDADITDGVRRVWDAVAGVSDEDRIGR